MYSIDSFFKLHQIALFTEDDVDLKKPIQTSQFVLLDKKGLVHISNMDYERVYSDISQTPPSPEYCTKVNFLVLDMIGAYDEQTEHNDRLLDLAEKICDWLRNIESMICLLYTSFELEFHFCTSLCWRVKDRLKDIGERNFTYFKPFFRNPFQHALSLFPF